MFFGRLLEEKRRREGEELQRQAQEALNSGDVEGVKTLATKAKSNDNGNRKNNGKDRSRSFAFGEG
jgi:hypothetical protein